DLWQGYLDALNKKNWEKALSVMGAFKEKEPSNPQVFLRTGDVLQRMGRIDDAVSAYHKAASLFSRGGFSEKALAIYKIILRLSPQDRQAAKEFFAAMNELEKERSHPARLEADSRSDGAEAVIFSSLTQQENARLVSSAARLAFEPGQVVVAEGGSGDSIYYMKNGFAAVMTLVRGREIELATLSAGDIFGEVAFLTGRPRTASVVAKSAVEAIEIGRRLLEEIASSNPAVMEELQDFYQKRAHDTVDKTMRALKPPSF
ncbi:MAG: cyclic nucleotide-binding domain-containing protein, partial [Nitrospiraceae bacterium]|nr:cyclic nucleotide-binding domain-containing protein [Nitrospiraceae bacterium]